jgi:hypothetical protein
VQAPRAVGGVVVDEARDIHNQTVLGARGGGAGEDASPADTPRQSLRSGAGRVRAAAEARNQNLGEMG